MQISLLEMKSDDAETVMLLSKQLGYDISLPETKNNIEGLIKQGDNKTLWLNLKIK